MAEFVKRGSVHLVRHSGVQIKQAAKEVRGSFNLPWFSVCLFFTDTSLLEFDFRVGYVIIGLPAIWYTLNDVIVTIFSII